MTNLQTIGTIRGSIQEGGWQAEGDIFGDADALDWYYPVKSWLRVFANGWESTPRLAFNGHLVPKAWTKTVQTSEAPWSAFTAQQFLKNGRVQGIFFQNATVPANDHQITDMTYADIIEHILGVSGQWGHCNLVQGVWPEGFVELDIDKTNSVLAGEHEVKEGVMWSRLNEIAKIENYLLFVDLQNVLHYIPHPMYLATLPTPVFDLQSDWLLNPLKITPRNTESVGQVILQGTTPQGQQINSRYPTNPTAGPSIVKSGYKAAGSTGMDTVAERQYLYSNRDVSVNATIPGAVGCMIDLMDRVSITYSSLADGVDWSAKKFWVEGVGVRVLENMTAVTELKLEAENSG